MLLPVTALRFSFCADYEFMACRSPGRAAAEYLAHPAPTAPAVQCGLDWELLLGYLRFVFPPMTKYFSVPFDPNLEFVPATWSRCRALPPVLLITPPSPGGGSALLVSSPLVSCSTSCCSTSSPGSFCALMCARVWQVLPEGQLRASGRAVPVCRQHQPVHERHRPAQQHLRLRAQPPGRCCRQAARGRPDGERHFQRFPRSQWTVRSPAFLPSHRHKCFLMKSGSQRDRGGKWSSEPGKKGVGMAETNSPSPWASAHISLGPVSLAVERKGFVSQKTSSASCAQAWLSEASQLLLSEPPSTPWQLALLQPLPALPGPADPACAQRRSGMGLLGGHSPPQAPVCHRNGPHSGWGQRGLARF